MCLNWIGLFNAVFNNISVASQWPSQIHWHTFITKHCIEHSSPWEGSNFTTLCVVCTGRCKLLYVQAHDRPRTYYTCVRILCYRSTQFAMCFIYYEILVFAIICVRFKGSVKIAKGAINPANRNRTNITMTKREQDE